MSWLSNLMPSGNSQQQQTQPQGQQQQPQGQQQQQPPANNQGQPGNNAGTINQNDGSNQQVVDPMDAYNKLWDNATAKTEAPPSFNLDAKTLDSVSAGMQFTQGMPTELMQRIQSGDMGAMTEMMDHVGRKAYQTAMQHSSALTDKFVGMREEHFNTKGLPSRMREELTLNAISGNEKIHPAAKKQLVDIAKRLQIQHPDASPQEIATQARTYVSDLYKAMNPESQQSSTNAQAAAETNWDSFFGE